MWRRFLIVAQRRQVFNQVMVYSTYDLFKWQTFWILTQNIDPLLYQEGSMKIEVESIS